MDVEGRVLEVGVVCMAEYLYGRYEDVLEEVLVDVCRFVDVIVEGGV